MAESSRAHARLGVIGTTLGTYRIEAEAGAGGMGVVYRATDTTLRRTVAIKILNAAAAADPERKRRFIQEAQAASALNHSDIVTIYQIGSEAAIDYIAMEFVAGRSLEEVIHGRPMPWREVIRVGGRIADALAAAHKAGIVHRDLKPSNVMITDEGGVKLLDFGVAKLMPLDALSTTAALPAATVTGMIIGTLAYMSPEQRDGASVDARSDIYSFGLVLHEMLTGHRPAADPDATSLSSTPADLRKIVRRCLQREPTQRFQMMADVRHALDDADADPPPAPASRRVGRTALAGTALFATAVLAAAGWLAWRSGQSPTHERPAVLTRLTMDSGLAIDPALSPDGRFIAFASDRSGEGNLDIWVRQVAGGDPVRLTSSPADDVEPAFSPDGSQIAFRSDRDGGGVYVSSTLGGDARRILDQCRRPRWSPSGTQIVCWSGLNSGFLLSKADAPRVFVVDAKGGDARRLFDAFAVAAAPAWSADGRQLIFLGRREARDLDDWWVADADGGSPRPSGGLKAIADGKLIAGGGGLIAPDAWTKDGSVLFSAAGLGDTTNIWSLQVGRDGRLQGTPHRLTDGTDIEVNATVDTAGAMAFAAIRSDIDLWSQPLDAAGGGAGAAQRLTQDPAVDLQPSLTVDGTQLVFGSNRSGTYDAWVRDLSSGKETIAVPRIPFPSLLLFTKDGLRVIAPTAENRWLSVPAPERAGTRNSAPQTFCNGCGVLWDFSADGRWALLGSEDDSVIRARELATGRTMELMRRPNETVGRLRISPDDRWMAFTNRVAGSVRIYVAPFQTEAPSPKDRWIAITPEETVANSDVWSASGDAIYYLSDRDGHFCLWRQPIDRTTGRPVSEPVAVWHFHSARLSMLRLPMGMRTLAVSRDRAVLSVAESSGNIWLAR